MTVLRTMRWSLAYQRGDLVPARQRSLMATAICEEECLSRSLRSHLRGTAGASIQHAKNNWALFKNFSEENARAKEAAQSLGRIQELVVRLEVAVG